MKPSTRHHDDASPLRAGPLPLYARSVRWLPVAAALALAVLLAIRPIFNADTGYHLAYGDHFLRTGQIVDHNDFLYTLPSPVPAAGGARAGNPVAAPDATPDLRPPPGPGCWYDDQGRYRFPNANWLSQIAMAILWRVADADGLVGLQALLVAGIFLVLTSLMHRLGLPPPAIAAGLLLAAMVGYERFVLRPELFTYLFLCLQLHLLVTWRTSPRRAATLVLLQLLLVNLHSYFLLGAVLTAAFLAQRLLVLLWSRVRHGAKGQAADGDRRGELARESKFLGMVAAGQLLVSFANPWTWRLALLPFETLAYLRGRGGADGGQPWGEIGELTGTFAPQFASTHATMAMVVLLALTAVALLVALFRGRVAWAIVMVAMTLASLAVRRNIALAAILVTPLTMACLWQLLQGRLIAGAIKRVRLHTIGPQIGLTLLLTAAAVVLSWAVVTNRFYYSDRSFLRFGGGWSELQMPLSAARWVSDHAPEGRLWTDMTASSNLRFFSRPPREVNVLTNTWAYPPAVLADVQQVNADGSGRAFETVREKYGLQCVVLRLDPSNLVSGPLAYSLAHSKDWNLSFVDGLHVVFVKRGLDATLDRRALRPATFDLQAYAARLRLLDTRPANGLYLGGSTLWELGWDDHAVELLRQADDEEGDSPGIVYQYGRFLALRANSRAARGEVASAADDLRAAIDAFGRVAAMEGDDPKVRVSLDAALEQLRRLEDEGTL